jgi:hypothetical protein
LARSIHQFLAMGTKDATVQREVGIMDGGMMRTTVWSMVLVSACWMGAATCAVAADCGDSGYLTDWSAGGARPADPAVLNTGNVLLNGMQADACQGHYDLADGTLGTTVDFANNLALFGQTNWFAAAKFAQNGTATSRTVSGLRFELVNVQGVGDTSGSFSLVVTDVNAQRGNTLPAIIDIAVMLSKGRNVNDFYFFDDERVTSSNSGVFTVGFANGNGLLDLSHINILVRNIRNAPDCQPGDTGCQSLSVPEPGALALVSLALMSIFGLSVRKRAEGRAWT